MKNEEEVKEKILQEEDFIHCPRLGNSVKKLLQKNPDGIDDERIAKVLLLPVEEVDKIYRSALNKLKNGMGL